MRSNFGQVPRGFAKKMSLRDESFFFFLLRNETFQKLAVYVLVVPRDKVSLGRKTAYLPLCPGRSLELPQKMFSGEMPLFCAILAKSGTYFPCLNQKFPLAVSSERT